MNRYLQAFSNAAVYQSLRNTTLAITGSLCTIGGLVADVLQPIAPFASYLFFLALAAFIVLFMLYRRDREHLLGAVAFAAVAAGIFGLIVLFQSSEEAEEVGVLAATVPGIGALQQQLGLIDEKLDAIADDTEVIRETTARLEESSREVMRTLEEMRASFAGDGIVAEPSSPEEFYRNARIQELGGNYTAARQSYLGYFRFDLPVLDPHLRFIDFLKVQEGTAGARETYATLMGGKDSAMADYVSLLLLPAAQRMAGLAAYAETHPDFAPVHYHLSLDYSERRLGSQSLADMRAERIHLQAFGAADADGGLIRHLIDQSLAQAWREDVAVRLQALASRDALLENPVSISWTANNSGYIGTVSIAEPVLELLWNEKGRGDPRSTGDTGVVDMRSGKPAPRMFLELPLNQRDTNIEIRYRDLRGELRGPYAFPFAAKKESADSNRRMLEATTTSWLSFRDYDGQRLLYFSHLMTYRGAIKSIRYGLNKSKPSKNYRFPAWRKGGIATIDEKVPLFIKVPRSTRYVTVQLTYKDGDKSAIQRFDYTR